MLKKICVVGIIVENPDSAEKINDILHEHRTLIAGRMGLPSKELNISIISIIIKGTQNEISSLTGKLGRIPGVFVKSAISSKEYEENE